RYSTRDLAGNPTERQIVVDPQSRHEVGRLQHLIGDRVDGETEIFDSGGLERQTRSLFMAAEADEEVRAPLERAEHVESGNTPARAVRNVAVHRQHDRGSVK